MRDWGKIIPEHDREVYEKAGCCTTSGCVRSTVIDAYSYGFPVFVVEEGVFDRSPFSHLVNLYEMNSKYATVITAAEALIHVKQLPGASRPVAGVR